MNESKGLFEPEDKSVNVIIIIITTIVFFIMELWEKSQTSGYFIKNTTQFLLEHGAAIELSRNTILRILLSYYPYLPVS